MINPSFQQLLYSQSLDTWVISSVAQVDALVDEVYQQFLGHELKNNSRKTKSTLKTILLNLYSAFVSDPELYLRYSRDENFYSSSNHYVSQFVSYQSLVTKVIPGLVRLSLIQDNPGFIDREFNTGFVSRMKSTAGLIDLFLKHKFQPWMLEVSSEKEVIILKNTEKKFERYKDTDFTRTAREQLQHINGHLQAAYIDLWISDEAMDDLLHQLRRSNTEEDVKHLSLFTNKTLYRIFSNSSWKQHGRFYGVWWQNIPKEYRQHLSINGDITVELDFSSFHPRMVYHLSGTEMVGHPYEGIDDLDRKHGKVLVNIMINAVDEDPANGAYRKKYRNEGVTKAEAKVAIDAAKEKHQAISKEFYTGVGLKLMNYDSQIANNVMLRAIDEYQTVILPLHDSFICITEFEKELRQLMMEEYIVVMKSEVPPEIDMKYSEHYQTEEEIEKEELFMAEYGTLHDYDTPLDPLQRERRKMLQKQTFAVQEKLGIRFEDAFTQETIEAKYAP